MKKLVAVLVLVLFRRPMPAVAGEKGKCAGSGEDCLKKMQTEDRAQGLARHRVRHQRAGPLGGRGRLQGQPCAEGGLRKG